MAVVAVAAADVVVVAVPGRLATDNVAAVVVGGRRNGPNRCRCGHISYRYT